MSDELKYCNFKFEDVPDGVKFKRNNENIAINIEMYAMIGGVVDIILALLFCIVGFALLNQIVGIFLLAIAIYFGYKIIPLKGTFKMEINEREYVGYKFIKGKVRGKKTYFNFNEVSKIYKKFMQGGTAAGSSVSQWILYAKMYDSKKIKIYVDSKSEQKIDYLLGALNRIKNERCN